MQALRPQATAALSFTCAPPTPEHPHTHNLHSGHLPAQGLQLYTHSDAQGLLVDVFTTEGHAQGRLLPPDQALPVDQGSAGTDTVGAPMPGRVLQVMAQVGNVVLAGQPLLVLEAMKMEHTLCAPRAGQLSTCLCAAGDQVQEGHELMRLAPLAPQVPQAQSSAPSIAASLVPQGDT